MELHDRPGLSDVEDPMGLPPADVFDPVIEAYKKDVDRTLLRENLKLTTEARSRKFEGGMVLVYELRRAGARLRAQPSKTE